MSIAYGRACVIHIPPAKARRKTPSVNTPLYVSNLREQNKYLGQLSTEIETKLSGLEHSLREPTTLQEVNLVPPLAALHRCLCVEAETFCKRLNLFLEEAKATPAPLSPNGTI